MERTPMAQSIETTALEKAGYPFSVEQYLTNRDDPKTLVTRPGSRVRVLTAEQTKQGRPCFFGCLYDQDDKFRQVVWVYPDQAEKRFQ